MHLRRRSIVALLLAGGVVVVAPADPAVVLSVAGGLVAVLVLTDIVRAPRASVLLPRRTIANVLRMGRQADVLIDLYNPTGRRLAVEVHDATPPSMGREPRRHRVTIAPRGWGALSGTLRPSRRGRFAIGRSRSEPPVRWGWLAARRR
jgi:uncharacterized protein (DUF58 family)